MAEWLAGLAAGVLAIAILAWAADRGCLPVYATAEEAAAVRARAPWDVRRAREENTGSPLPPAQEPVRRRTPSALP